MRKILRPVCLLLILMCTFACAEEALRGYDAREGYVYLTLGTFPQTKEGAELPILWRVLSVQDSRALLLSEHVLEARRIHGDYDEYANKPTNQKKPGFDGDFTQTEMSQYLRGDFTVHFTPEEMALLTPDEAMGLFFLLTSEDLKNKDYGFDSNQSRKAWATEYAIANGVFVYRAARGSHSPYWSCTQSTTNIQGARCIKSQGELGYINVITENLGLRPACWLDLAQVHIQSGTGTKDDPYLLSPGALPDAAGTANPS